MLIEVMPLDTQTFTTYECDDFEFRANQVTNWLKIRKDGKETMIKKVAVIKHISGKENHVLKYSMWQKVRDKCIA